MSNLSLDRKLVRNYLPEKLTEFVSSVYPKYRFYIVGGAVRDLILGKVPKDIDLATPSTPKENISLFVDKKIKYVLTGVRYGTVTFFIDGEGPFEVTSFRKDIGYTGRRPKEVVYIENLEEDSRRRDFTFNSIYWSPISGLIDLHNGVNDLILKKVKFIGSYVDRLTEDKLRLMRYLRFKLIYGNDSWNWAEKHLLDFNLHLIAKERVWDEISKLISSEEFNWNRWNAVPKKLLKRWMHFEKSKLNLRAISQVMRYCDLLEEKQRVILKITMLTMGRFEGLSRFLGNVANRFIKIPLKNIKISSYPDYRRAFHVTFAGDGFALTVNLLRNLLLSNSVNGRWLIYSIVSLRRPWPRKWLPDLTSYFSDDAQFKKVRDWSISKAVFPTVKKIKDYCNRKWRVL